MSGSLKGIKHQELLDNGLANRMLNKAVLAINAGGAATVKTTAAPIVAAAKLLYTVAGVAYAASDLAAQALTSAGTYVQPASTTVYYVCTLDAAGTFRSRQSNYAGRILDAASTKGGVVAGTMGQRGDGMYPAVPSTECVIGMIKIVTGAAGSFTPGTTALDAANMTVTFYDLAGGLPATIL